MAYKSISQQRKAQKAGKQYRRELRQNLNAEIAQLSDVQKIELEISELKIQIKHCDNDLMGLFRNNTTIIKKREILKNNLNLKQEELKKAKVNT